MFESDDKPSSLISEGAEEKFYISLMPHRFWNMFDILFPRQRLFWTWLQAVGFTFLRYFYLEGRRRDENAKRGFYLIPFSCKFTFITGTFYFPLLCFPFSKLILLCFFMLFTKQRDNCRAKGTLGLRDFSPFYNFIWKASEGWWENPKVFKWSTSF